MWVCAFLFCLLQFERDFIFVFIFICLFLFFFFFYYSFCFSVCIFSPVKCETIRIIFLCLPKKVVHVYPELNTMYRAQKKVHKILYMHTYPHTSSYTQTIWYWNWLIIFQLQFRIIIIQYDALAPHACRPDDFIIA